MGGYNSIVKWVEAKEPLANKDYAHLNYKGASIIGKNLANNILEEYYTYKSIITEKSEEIVLK